MMDMERIGTEGRSLRRWPGEVGGYNTGANHMHRGNRTNHYKLEKGRTCHHRDPLQNTTTAQHYS